MVLTGYASDVDWPLNTLTYSLLSANPGGLLLNATNGVITWTPSEAQGPGSYSITIRVADNGIPSLSATQTFTVNVTESNSPPVLGLIPNQTVYQGETVVIPVTAVDSDLPANELTITLLSAPTNASFTNNTFVWRPTAVQAGATYPVGIVVTDNGLPPLSATQTFQVTVNRLAQLSAQSLGANRVSISVSGRSNVIYTLEASTNLFFWESVLVTNSPAAVFEVIESTSPAGLRIYRIREQRQY